MAKAARKPANASRTKGAAKSAPMLENGKVVSRRRNRKPLERRARSTPDPTIPPPRQTNASRRKREYLTPDEVDKLLQASSKLGRHGGRDRALILLAYRHGLRISELVALRWDQVDLKAGLLHVRRAKNGIPSTHPMQGDELRSLRQLAREWPDHGGFVFVSERGGPLSADGVL